MGQKRRTSANTATPGGRCRTQLPAAAFGDRLQDFWQEQLIHNTSTTVSEILLDGRLAGFEKLGFAVAGEGEGLGTERWRGRSLEVIFLGFSNSAGAVCGALAEGDGAIDVDAGDERGEKRSPRRLYRRCLLLGERSERTKKEDDES